jgi:hypothetical protein
MTPCAVAYLPYCTVFCILYLIAPIQVDWKEEKNDNTRPAVKSIDRTAGAAIEEFKVRLVANSCTYCLHEVLTWTTLVQYCTRGHSAYSLKAHVALYSRRREFMHAEYTRTALYA